MAATKKAVCGTKRQHLDRSAALTHLLSLVRAGAQPGTMRAYRCKWCAAWHVGHLPGYRKRRR
jgi:hypothetical protein